MTEADLIAMEASVLLHRVADLEVALHFYGDPRRYEGPHQPIDGEPDKYQPKDASCLWDVASDGGRIARDALNGTALSSAVAAGMSTFQAESTVVRAEMRFDTSLWEREHGKKPSGKRKWRFRIVSPHNTVADYEFTVSAALTFPSACRVAIERARQRHSDRIVVLP
ncbi:hypothetical protein NLM33_35105 [Bradyrhizobium sp. CCGUVB1N3]|uniref:hypothetical protein n=1 Tax=Bradyrhizobium sp. CCGUVB1N3 TaxID=2949629 RepID=UPI0020B2A53E|nr:hypothetical protein [Bradyrhizobium sp. CCGUVB1N3]MCP3475522.1 hypothetical protein [Bradyrhizobium sp. CCGUVB1N3]